MKESINEMINKDDNIHKQQRTKNHGFTNGQSYLWIKYPLFTKKERKKKKVMKEITKPS